MALHNEIGKLGESIAIEYLQKKAYQIITVNWVHGKKEIDIIARDKEILVFTEVKIRKNNDFVNVDDAVNLKKQKLLIKAANEYIIQRNIKEEVRFDIIWIILDISEIAKDAYLFPEKFMEKASIEHIEDAFYPI